jgi:hypothetical protein
VVTATKEAKRKRCSRCKTAESVPAGSPRWVLCRWCQECAPGRSCRGCGAPHAIPVTVAPDTLCASCEVQGGLW